MKNKLSRLISAINKFPSSIRSFLITQAFCSKVKFAGTSKIKILYVDQSKALLKLANRRKVQNHIGGIHAVAAAVLAESATGIVFGMNVQDKCLPLLKSMKVDYERRMQGDLTANAHLTTEQQQEIQRNEKGTLIIPVIITDESGLEPILCQMEWAWVAKRK